MPIYEYRCSDCSREFEAILLGSERPTCPGCGSARLEKRLSVFAVGNGGASAAAREPAGPCGTCGDPRGAGSCALD